MQDESLVYHCKRTSLPNAEIETFAKPLAYRLKPMYMTVQPASGFSNIAEFGENVGKKWTMFCFPIRQWQDQINIGDRFYLDKSARDYVVSDVEPEDGWGYDANARVEDVREQNQYIKVILQKIE
jgi:hypothetical protein